MTNRFVEKETRLARPTTRFNPKARGGTPYTRQASKKSNKCDQFNEMALAPDEFALDILQFFFSERLKPNELNSELREMAATCIWEAVKASKSMDMVPRPTINPTFTWLVKEAVQIAIRRSQNKCIYEAVRVTLARNFRSAYEIAKFSGTQSIQWSDPLTNTHSTSNKGVALIKSFEGFRTNLYDDPAGHCTIGYGHLVHRNNCNGTESDEFQAGITETRATALLKSKLASFENTVNSKVTVTLNQQQFDALVSFANNVGSGAFSKSTLLKKLNNNDYVAVLSELNRWVKGGGRTLPGLLIRRNAEGILFRDGTYPGDTSTDQSLYGTLSQEDDNIDSMDIDEYDDDPRNQGLTQSLSVPSFCAKNAAATASSAHFSLNEFDCRDGTVVPTDLRGHVQTLMNQLEVLRTELGNKSITVTSGYRTVTYNTKIGGAVKSRHLCAQASDIKVPNCSPKKVADTIERLISTGKMLQGGLGRYSTFTHYDIRGTRARWGSN